MGTVPTPAAMRKPNSLSPSSATAQSGHCLTFGSNLPQLCLPLLWAVNERFYDSAQCCCFLWDHSVAKLDVVDLVARSHGDSVRKRKKAKAAGETEAVSPKGSWHCAVREDRASNSSTVVQTPSGKWNVTLCRLQTYLLVTCIWQRFLSVLQLRLISWRQWQH